MKFKIKDIDFFWDFTECYSFCFSLLELYELESVQFNFNGCKLTVYKDTTKDELFKYYQHNVK